jgi:hypothetical protein
MAETRVEWLGLLEKTSDVPVYDELDRYQNTLGRQLLADYTAKVKGWATTLPPADELDPQQVADLFGPPTTREFWNGLDVCYARPTEQQDLTAQRNGPRALGDG